MAQRKTSSGRLFRALEEERGLESRIDRRYQSWTPGSKRKQNGQKKIGAILRRKRLLVGAENHREQVTERVARTLELEDRQTGLGRSFPIPFGVVPDVQSLVRPGAAHTQRAAEDFGVGFIGAEFAGEKNMREEFRDAEMLEDHPQAAVEIRNYG